MELDCKEKYYKLFAEQKDQAEFFEDSKEAVRNYVKRYDIEHPDDVSREFIYSFRRFFEEEFINELEKIRQERQPKGWHENGQRLTSEEMEAVIDTPYSHEKQLEYSEVLREICRIYPVANRTYKAYSNLFFAIVNQYEDATGANLIYTAVSEYLDDMQRKGCCAIPEFAYWLKNNAVGIMGSLTEYKKII